ncbi:MAG: hypothetical protein P8M80_06495 [Pirellulaceae bacterium]|nr:hypothetical protein [Pirellulaceae bacterium]
MEEVNRHVSRLFLLAATKDYLFNLAAKSFSFGHFRDGSGTENAEKGRQQQYRKWNTIDREKKHGCSKRLALI